MILPDVNLLLHAYNAESPDHDAARAWLEELLSGTTPAGFAWVALLGFIRIATNPRVMSRPLPVTTATGHVRKWIAQPYSRILEPTPRHLEVLFGLIERVGTAANLTTDAHLAALAIEHQAELRSTDADFARFPGLRWSNPIARR